MEATNPKQDQYSPKQKARVFSFLLILLWLIFLLIPMFIHVFPLPEKTGILLSFGDNSGGNTEITDVENLQKKSTDSEETEISEAEKNEESKETTDSNTKDKEVSEEESPVQIAVNDQQSKQEKESTSATAAQPEEEEKEDFSSFFTQGEGKQNEEGNPGDPRGSPDIKRLEGIVSGKSTVGGGIADRGIIYEPDIQDDSQKTGKVVIKVCVNQNGEVISAKYTQRGSTTNDLELIKIAEDAAKKYKFSSSGIEEQCGQISIDFILK